MTPLMDTRVTADASLRVARSVPSRLPSGQKKWLSKHGTGGQSMTIEFVYEMGVFLLDLAFWFFGMTFFLGLSFLIIAFLWKCVWKELKEEEEDG
jgi:hypothetical protein